jgi:glycosyltransferase involved in cell wall biosynthesis
MLENGLSGPAVLLINSLGTGGAERAVVAAAARLKEVGRDVRILCLECVPSPEALDTDVHIEYLSNLSSTANPLLKLIALPFLAHRLSAYLSAFGVSVVMSHLFRANFVNVLARELAGSRHRAVLVNHTRVSRLSGEGLQGRINWALCRMLYPRADCVASVSTGAANECARLLGLPPAKSITLYDPIDTSASAAAASSAQPIHAIVAVGRLVGLKRFQDLISAFAAIALDFPNLELRIAGGGPGLIRLERRAVATGFSKRIRFLGQSAEPATVMAGCSVFVSTSETEGFGMAIVEALAAGIPVIASDCAYGPREILAPSTDPTQLLESRADIEIARYGILYPVGSVEMLEKALRRVLADSALREELARRAPERAADFSIDRSTRAYQRLLFFE